MIDLKSAKPVSLLTMLLVATAAAAVVVYASNNVQTVRRVLA